MHCLMTDAFDQFCGQICKVEAGLQGLFGLRRFHCVSRICKGVALHGQWTQRNEDDVERCFAFAFVVMCCAENDAVVGAGSLVPSTFSC